MVEGPDTSKTDEAIHTKNEVPRRKSKEDKQPTKVVIRRLPGTMTEQSFLEHVSPLFEHDYFYFVQGENPSFGENNFSRAYINFLNVEDVFTFTMKFDDYVFLDDAGQEFPAVVEFAPFQRIPKSKSNRKHDPACGTIEDDPDYQEFIRQLECEEQEHKPNQLTEHYFDLANDENEEKVTTTPLLEFLASRKNEWIKYKEEKKEERRRRDLERRKQKEEKLRIKKENREAKLEKVAKIKEEKKRDVDSKISEDSKSVTSTRVKGKSYQEERQRDLARRKHEEKSVKSGDTKEAKDSVKGDLSPDQTLEDVGNTKTDPMKNEKRADREEKSDIDYKRKYEEKKVYRGEERRFSHTREREDKKTYHGIKKREYANGFEHDGKHKRDSYHYEDYKTRNHSSHQKSGYPSKYGSSKNTDYEEKVTKRYESKKKYDAGDYKDTKKSYQWEKERRSSESKEVDKSITETKVTRKEHEGTSKGDEKIKETKATSSSKQTESAAEGEIKTKETKTDDKKDDRAERRIKNKDRPALEIYRPGMGKFSRQRLERNKSTDSKEGD